MGKGVRVKELIILLSSVLLLLFVISASGEQYSNVASIFELGMGARPLAMGGAFVGLADDGNAVFYNPAGLAWAQGVSVLFSYEARLGTASYGNLSASLPHLGFGVHYFDFGRVPQTDEFGNIIGTFSYRDYVLIAAVGTKAGDIPFLTWFPFADNIGFGLGVKFLNVSTLDTGGGSGFAADLSFLFRSESASSRLSIITSYGFGFVFENLLGIPIKYGSGHQENWLRKLVAGMSVGLLDQVILAMDVTSEKNVRLGVEWTPISAISIRAGLRYEGVWMWSLGVGTRFQNFAFGLAAAFHPYLNSQFRGSLEITW